MDMGKKRAMIVLMSHAYSLLHYKMYLIG